MSRWAPPARPTRPRSWPTWPGAGRAEFAQVEMDAAWGAGRGARGAGPGQQGSQAWGPAAPTWGGGGEPGVRGRRQQQERQQQQQQQQERRRRRAPPGHRGAQGSDSDAVLRAPAQVAQLDSLEAAPPLSPAVGLRVGGRVTWPPRSLAPATPAARSPLPCSEEARGERGTEGGAGGGRGAGRTASPCAAPGPARPFPLPPSSFLGAAGRRGARGVSAWRGQVRECVGAEAAGAQGKADPPGPAPTFGPSHRRRSPLPAALRPSASAGLGKRVGLSH